MRIFATPHSLYCAKLRIILHHKGINFEEVSPPGGPGSAAYLDLVPSGNLPALQDGDLTLTDSEAIAEYLEEKHPEPRMLPNDLRLRALSRERSRFADTRLEPALRLTFPHVDPKNRVPEAIEHAHIEISKRLNMLGVMLQRSDLPRDRLWLGDPGTIVTLAWIQLFDGLILPNLSWPDSVVEYFEAMKQHSSVTNTLKAYRPHMTEYLRAKGVL